MERLFPRLGCRLLRLLLLLCANTLYLSPPVAAAVLGVPEQQLQAAQREFFPDARDFVPWPLDLSRRQLKQIRRYAGASLRPGKTRAWRVEAGDGRGGARGWFYLDNVIGKHEYISYALGVDATGAVVGLRVLVYRETHGGEVRASGWRAQFIGKTLADPLKLDRDIDGIAGATLSSRNLIRGARKLLMLSRTLNGPGS